MHHGQGCGFSRFSGTYLYIPKAYKCCVCGTETTLWNYFALTLKKLIADLRVIKLLAKISSCLLQCQHLTDWSNFLFPNLCETFQKLTTQALITHLQTLGGKKRSRRRIRRSIKINHLQL